MPSREFFCGSRELSTREQGIRTSGTIFWKPYEVFSDRLTTPFLQNTCRSAIRAYRAEKWTWKSCPNCARTAIQSRANLNPSSSRLRVASCWAATIGCSDNASSTGRLPCACRNQIRTYWWCSPPRIGRQRICPASSTAREIGASFSKDKCVRISL